MTTQRQFLVNTLRGTGMTMTAREGREMHGIQQMGARMSEIRAHGLRVRTTPNYTGGRGRPSVTYRISSRGVDGSRARVDV